MSHELSANLNYELYCYEEKHIFEGVKKMSEALKEMDKRELVDLERLAYLLRGLSPVELETLEILLDKEASTTISQSLKELEQGKGIPINEW